MQQNEQFSPKQMKACTSANNIFLTVLVEHTTPVLCNKDLWHRGTPATIDFSIAFTEESKYALWVVTSLYINHVLLVACLPHMHTTVQGALFGKAYKSNKLGQGQ